MHLRATYLLPLVFFICFGSFCLAQSKTKAILLDAEQDSLCGVDCPLIPLPNSYGDYLYCFQAGDKLLIGEHQAWEIGLKKLARLKGKTFSLHYDDAHIWVRLPGGWQVRLSQYYFEYSFKDESCRTAARMRSFERGYTRPEPVPGPAIPVMRGKVVFGWAICSPRFYENLVNCTVWDLKGNIRQKRIYQLRESSLPSQIPAWNDASEGNFRIIHLEDGRTFQLYEIPLKARELEKTSPISPTTDRSIRN